MVLKKQIIEENESLKITSICRFLMSVYAVSETKTFKSKSFCCCCSHIHENNRKALNAFPPLCNSFCRVDVLDATEVAP